MIPFAIPFIAGPALFATIMLFSHLLVDPFAMVVPIISAWLLALGILVLSRPLMRLLGPNGLIAIERLMGMVLVLLAIQRFMDGVRQFVTSQLG